MCGGVPPSFPTALFVRGRGKGGGWGEAGFSVLGGGRWHICPELSDHPAPGDVLGAGAHPSTCGKRASGGGPVRLAPRLAPV